MDAGVRVSQVSEARWQVSVVRELGRSCVVEGDRHRVVQLAVRAASLLPRWERASERARTCRVSRSSDPRYLVVDPSGEGSVRLPDGRQGELLASYRTPELATALARDHQQCGGSAVVMDSLLRRLVYSSSWPEESLDGDPASARPRRRR